MKKTKREVFETYGAYNEGMFDMETPLKASFAYKLCKNLEAMRAAHKVIANDIEALRKEYGWQKDAEYNAGLSDEAYKEYSDRYDAMLDEVIDVNIIPISMSELNDTISIEQMLCFVSMIAAEE